MCGIVGFWAPGGGDLHTALAGMCDALVHRGPDSSGEWFEKRLGVALGHRRLAIIDTSPLGHQPMVSSSGRFVLTFNGEIYNYQELRKDLLSRGRTFRGGSDTEVLLEAFEEWGIEKTLSRSHGMLSMGLWDHKTQSLTLARDKVGKKPLYYGYSENGLLFGSELKAFLASPKFKREIDRNALNLFFRGGYIPTPFSIFEGVRKLEAGSFLTLTEKDVYSRIFPVAQCFWNVSELARRGERTPLEEGSEEIINGLHAILKVAVRERMISDVPLGAMLSGGIDSSLVVALMQAESVKPVKTFSIGFEEREFNEAPHAALVAKHLKTDHTELYLTSRNALDVVPLLSQIYDEPFADSSQIPTYLVSKLARSGVTVALSGDGGDELFGGYPRYLWAQRMWSLSRLLGSLGRNTLSLGLTTVSTSAWERIFSLSKPILPTSLSFKSPGTKLHRFAEVMSSASLPEFYDRLVTYWDGEIVKGVDRNPLALGIPRDVSAVESSLSKMMLTDMKSYLPDDILVKVDRASMAVSLEARAPLLDPRVIEFAWRIPGKLRIRDGVSKWPLRQILNRYVPREITDRPKMGFGIPFADWLRGPLREWAEELLSERKLAEGEYLNPEPIRARWSEHLTGKHNWQYMLWPVLMWQEWRMRYLT